MKKLLFLLLIAPALAHGQAQNYGPGLITDTRGTPISPNEEGIRQEGSPFLSDTYCPARLYLTTGKYHDLLAKLDLETNTIFFKTRTGTEMMSVMPVERIHFDYCNDKSPAFRRGFPAVDKFNENSFYEILSEGNVSLLKAYRVSHTDNKAYNSALVTRVYNTATVLYGYFPGKGMMKIPRNEQELSALFSDHRNEVDRFVRVENIRIKKEEDLIRLFNFYNGLGEKKK